jgi:hypothetical protein
LKSAWIYRRHFVQGFGATMNLGAKPHAEIVRDRCVVDTPSFQLAPMHWRDLPQGSRQSGIGAERDPTAKAIIVDKSALARVAAVATRRKLR